MPSSELPRYCMAPTFRVERDGGRLRVHTGAASLLTDEIALVVLQAFFQPRPLVATAGDAELCEPEVFRRVVAELLAVGLLVPEADADSLVSESGFDAPEVHTRLLNDRERTRAFLRAVSEVVEPGDSVVDIGAGTGILAVAAAVAGARVVWAIESGRVALLAERLAASNGVSNRVRVIRDWSTSAAPDDLCDVLVTETIGDEPFAERVLESVLDAKRRLLARDARFVPAAVHVKVGLHEAPGTCIVPQTGQGGWKVPWPEAARWRRLCTWLDQDGVRLASHRSAQVDAMGEALIIRAGRANVATISAELELGNGIRLATDRPDTANNWSAYVVPLAPFEVVPGQRIRIRYRYGHSGVPAVHVEL